MIRFGTNPLRGKEFYDIDDWRKRVSTLLCKMPAMRAVILDPGLRRKMLVNLAELYGQITAIQLHTKNV